MASRKYPIVISLARRNIIKLNIKGKIKRTNQDFKKGLAE